MKVAPIVSGVLFAIACSLPALEFTKTQNGREAMMGLNVLAVGWSGIFAGVVAWYANPVWLAGLILAFAGKPRLAAVAGIVALLIGCTTFTLFGKDLPADEGGVTHMAITRVLIGCYFWLASLATLPVLVLFAKAK